MGNLIIFGGTFDPIHNGHLRLMMYASLKLNADVVLVPAKSPRWKAPLTSSEHRLKMVKLALKNAPSGTIISDFELKSKADINYTIDTVRYLKKKYKNDKLYLLIGVDQVNRFSEWKNAEELASLTRIIYIDRPGYKVDKKVVETYKMTSMEFYNSGEVSSTDVRELKSLDVPNEVLTYIEKHRLYFVNKIAMHIDEARLRHSIEVAHLAYLIAKKNQIDNPERAYIAGILHDVGKSKDYIGVKGIEFMKKHYPSYLTLPPFSFHQFIGEYIARTEFDIKDESILNAIKFHCTGNANMDEIAQIVYLSDKIEPTRGFDSSWLIASALKDYHQGFIDTLTDNKKYLLKHNKDITNKLTDACFNMYLK